MYKFVFQNMKIERSNAKAMYYIYIAWIFGNGWPNEELPAEGS